MIEHSKFKLTEGKMKSNRKEVPLTKRPIKPPTPCKIINNLDTEITSDQKEVEKLKRRLEKIKKENVTLKKYISRINRSGLSVSSSNTYDYFEKEGIRYIDAHDESCFCEFPIKKKNGFCKKCKGEIKLT